MKSRKSPSKLTAVKRILVVDDHPMTRHGVAQRIRIERDLEVCSDVGTAKAALMAVAKLAPDLVLADLSLGERSGLELIKDLHVLHPEVPVLVFSMHYETLYAERVLRAGARGYIMKSEGAEKLLEAIRCVLAGNVYLSPVMRDRAVHRFAHGPAAVKGNNAAALSDRELEVFELIGQGLGTRQITDRLRLSTSTIETHRAHIKEKLNLQSATELVRAAVEWVASRGS
jgi:DNA-binding NarL/FixJ family response regulator